MTRQRSKFWTFLFSLIPGCGQLYMGFMKRGLSMLLLFAASSFVAALLNMGELSLLIIVVWLYAFFDALNIGWLPPERFALLEDQYLFTDGSELKGIFKSRGEFGRYVGFGLIAFGVAFLWQNTVTRIIDAVYSYNPALYELLWTVNNALPRIVISVLLILLGVKMIRAKKEQTDIALPQPEQEDKK